MSMPSAWRSKLTALLLTTAALGQACSSNDTTTNTGTIAVSIAPTSATVQQGSSTTVTGTLTVTNFTGVPTVTVTGMPSGVTATPVISGTSAVVTIAVSSSAATGVYPLTIEASGTGLTAATATFTLTVAAATPASYTMTVGSPTLSIAQGANGTAVLTFVRTNFTGNVTLSVDNLPTGTTASFSPSPASGLTDTLTLTSSATATLGLANLVIRGTAAGLTDVTAPLALTVTPAPGFTIATAPATLSVVQGASNITGGVKATRVGGFSGTIAYSLAGAPAGVTATFATTSVTDSEQVTVTATGAAVPGTYAAVIHGISGTIDQTTPLSITVTAAAGFTIVATPVTLPVVQGSSTITGGVKATRTGGFGGAIVYTLAGAPVGVTATFAATSVPDSSQVTITATGATVPGTYATVIHGTSGAIDQTTPLSITVTLAPGSTVRLDYSACLASAKPVWVAFQDGSGAWTRVTGTGDVYTFNVVSAKNGLAVVTQSGATFNTAVQYSSLAELVANVGGCATVSNNTKSVNGSVIGMNTGDLASMSLGGSSAIVAPNTTFVLPAVAAGTFDLVGYDRNTVTPGMSDRGLLRRDQNPTAGATLPVADFGGAESFAVVMAHLTLNNTLAGDQISQSMSYLTGAACTPGPLYQVAPSQATSVPMFGVPTAQQRATDFHSMALADIGGSQIRTVSVSFHTMADKTVALGGALSPTVTNVTGAAAYKRLQAAVVLPSDYAFSIFTYTDTPGNNISITQTAAYLGGATSLTLAAPDFTGAAGFNSTWLPATGAAVTYSLSATSALPTSACIDGATAKFASISGTM